MLKAEWSNVHEDACKLEHALTKNVAALLEERLGYPKVCPHGNPIPTESGLIEEQTRITLLEANPDESYIVESIIDEEQKDLESLAEKRIIPNATIQITKQDKHRVILRVEGKEQYLSKNLAAIVKIRKKEGPTSAI